MSLVQSTPFRKATSAQVVDAALIEKVRWSIRQRLRKQWANLSTNFFDEVDDFLFASGQQKQHSLDVTYLNAMREIRTKKGLFEDVFLQAALAKMRPQANDCSASLEKLSSNPEHNVLYEKMEVDLALEAMSRKSAKFYLPLIKQIDTLNDKFKSASQGELIFSDLLIGATLIGFTEAQKVINLPLDIRLIFIKLFEQNFLLQMEKLFLDIISILSNIDNKSFVEKLYSSSSSFRIQQAKKIEAVTVLSSPLEPQTESDSVLVENSVNKFVESFCENQSLPTFIVKMINVKWREVLLLIGLNRGVTSIEWQEATHTISLLTAIVSKQVVASSSEMSALQSQICQGLSLAQIEQAEQLKFIHELEEFLALDKEVSVECNDATVYAGSIDYTCEVTVSPAGEQVLDREDLDEIAQLINGNPSEARSNSSQKQISQYFTEIDQLPQSCSVQLLIDRVAHECLLIKHSQNPVSFLITNKCFNRSDNSGFQKIEISRSRLGLAISMLDGELRVEKPQQGIKPTQVTVLENIFPKGSA